MYPGLKGRWGQGWEKCHVFACLSCFTVDPRGMEWIRRHKERVPMANCLLDSGGCFILYTERLEGEGTNTAFILHGGEERARRQRGGGGLY